MLSTCTNDSKGIPENGNADIGLYTALIAISRDNIQSSLNHLAADEREGRFPGTRGYAESARYVNAYMKDHWHQPSNDLSQPTEWETALKFARATVPVGYRTAMEGERPTWNESDFFGEMYDKQ